jgi:Icc-related predicted phosphoesterase
VCGLYTDALTRLSDSAVPFLIGGAYALERYTGIARDTKDLDIFLRQRDVEPALAALSTIGCRTEVTFPHWLAKAVTADGVIDVIFSSGNGVARVDDGWFTHAVDAKVFGLPVKLCAPEETIWSKAFIMERERFDGADVAHLLRACGPGLDWHRLLRRFGPHWRVLFGHLVLFGFIYPGERWRIPLGVMRELSARLAAELDARTGAERICYGTMLSRGQYLSDVEKWEYRDARLAPTGAIGDLHCPKTSTAVLHPLLAHAVQSADVLVLCGDLTDHGLEDEARTLAKELSGVKIPLIAVLGNHDYEAGKPEAVTAVLVEAGVHVLDGDSVEVEGVGFAGAKGFAGGFGERALQPWGEPSIKAFVHEAVAEALKLETALAKLRTPMRVALLHYSPIHVTLEGEPPEIYPFLGSSRLEEPLIRYPVSAVFHGHAHRGRLEGRTRDGAPVYNVSLPLLLAEAPDRPAVRVVELARPQQQAA